ncbi:patatin-like phospholipase family protein [Marinithermus hydrothermalis]|uniref:Patatin n=1 Tax=Marinithermus hydrothermalis (strain DSM 14884 / JCM 11576 / T1) TaxID=869210 RepID=F2NMC7_MARHT|nr:patatin-like phospholipase family protein [Marinithermus hydrothermalis]AEB11815.1 Patatin [Marinithermus hydrothermalis DSM 14884]
MRIGVALSGGGARGFAHIGVLEALEARGVEVACVAGTSMGAIVGALWAHGVPAREIYRLAERTPWVSLLNFVPRGGLVSGRKLRAFLAEYLPPTFEALERELVVVATDLASGEAVYLTRGTLPTAVLASAAYPGLLAPVEWEGRWLIDGGVVDNLPVDAARLLGADRVVAVDVTPGAGLPKGSDPPRSLIGTARRAVDVMLARLTAVRLALYPPEVYIRPEIPEVRFEDFGRLEEIVARGREAAEAALGAYAD